MILCQKEAKSIWTDNILLPHLRLDPGMAHQTQNSFEARKKSSRNRGCQKYDHADTNQRQRVPWDLQSNALTARLPTAAAESTENLWYLCTDLINVYCILCSNPDPNPRGRGQPGADLGGSWFPETPSPKVIN